MHSFQVMENYPDVFKSFINFDLLMDLMALGKDREVKERFSAKYNLGYIGEVGERWHEREGLIADNHDLLALMVAISSSVRDDVMYNQRERFCIQAVNHLLTVQYDFVTAAAVLSYGAIPYLNDENSQMAFMNLFYKVLEDEKSISHLTTGETAFVLYHLVMANRELYSSKAETEEAFLQIKAGIKRLAFTLVDQLIAQGIKFESAGTAFDDVPVIEMLANIYQAFDKPKAKEFKTKGAVRYLQCFEALMHKEIDFERACGIKDLLNLQQIRSVYIYNYELAYLRNGCDSRISNITAPGKERIENNFIRYGFLSSTDLEREYKKRLEIFRNGPKLRRLFDCMNQFENISNLEYFVLDLAADIILNQIGRQHIELIKKGLLTDTQKHRVAIALLEGNRTNEHKKLEKENFLYLYEIIERLHSIDPEAFKYPSSTLTFITNCLDYELLKVTDIEEIKLLNAEEQVIKYLHGKEYVLDLLDFLSRINIAYHSILIDSQKVLTSILIKGKYSREIVQRFYEMVIEAIFHHYPNQYASEIYKMQKEDEIFKSTFELTVEELTGIEKALFESEMLYKNEQAELYEKYTSDEEKEKNHIEKLKVKLRSCNTHYEVSEFYKSNFESIYKCKELSEIYALKFVELWNEARLNDEYDKGKYLAVFYNLKSIKLLSEKQLQMIEDAILEKYRVSNKKYIDKLTTV